MSPVTSDPNDPRLKEIDSTGMQKAYLVLSDEERAKGFVRPLRREYKHVGVRPKHPTRALTEEELERYAKFGYVAFEPYPDSRSAATGRFWTQAQLDSGCGTTTMMGYELAATYVRDPSFYGGTFCCRCGAHFPVGEHGEFEWLDGTKVGT